VQVVAIGVVEGAGQDAAQVLWALAGTSAQGGLEHAVGAVEADRVIAGSGAAAKVAMSEASAPERKVTVSAAVSSSVISSVDGPRLAVTWVTSPSSERRT
jgi:hypothetical protein